MCGSKIQKRCIVNEEFVFIVEDLQRHVDMEGTKLTGIMATTECSGPWKNG
jgi:hypothetical protein